jgi:hypothetical protein
MIEAPPQPGLRLSRLLEDLTHTAAGRAEPRTAGDVEADHARDGSITMAEVIDHTRHAGFGFLIAFVALVSIPFFAMSLPFGLAIAALGGQMLAGRERPWLPRRVAGKAVGTRTLRWLGTRLARATRWLETLVRPRWRGLISGGALKLAGLGITILGVGLALPIPLPGSNWIFIAPIVIYAIGLLEDDGALIAIGHAATLILIGASVVFSHLVVAGIVHTWHWLHP